MRLLARLDIFTEELDELNRRLKIITYAEKEVNDNNILAYVLILLEASFEESSIPLRIFMFICSLTPQQSYGEPNCQLTVSSAKPMRSPGFKGAGNPSQNFIYKIMA